MKKFKFSNTACVTAALVLAAAVLFTNISKSSIWHDEGYTMMLAPQSVVQVLARTARDVHPPGHYLTLHFWMELFGTSELAARSLSAVFVMATIVAMFFLVKRLFGEKPARLSLLFLALAPFLIRYGQEARMYAMVAFLLAFATLKLVMAFQERETKYFYIYGLLMAAALYTHYYTIFMIAAHWLYVGILTWPEVWKAFKQKRGLFNPHWWGGNFLAAGLFLPWVPVAYAQFSRVQSAFWIPPVGPHTIPNTVGQFLTFTDLAMIPLNIRLGVLGLFGLLVLVVLWRNGGQRRNLLLLLIYAGLAPAAVFALSFGRPIYVDRYFVFSSAAFYALLATLLYLKPIGKVFRGLAVLTLVGAFIYGITNVSAKNVHEMRFVGKEVSSRFETGDEIVAGELYVYFDFSYYNSTGQNLKLLAPDGVTGFGETSLLYDRADELLVRDFSELKPATGVVWVIGKTGQHDYFDKVPANWSPVGARLEAGYSAAQKYLVD